MTRFLVLLVLPLLAISASASSLVLPYDPTASLPVVMFYGVAAYDGGEFPFALSGKRVVAVSGFAEVETSGAVADLRALQFSYPAASVDLTIDPNNRRIPISITIDATTERIENLSPPAPLASFDLALPGEQGSYIDPAQHLQRMSFGFTLQTAGTSFHLGGADCESSESVCIHPLSGFTGTVDGFALTRLEFQGGTPFINDPTFVPIPLGTDEQGISWALWLTTFYPEPVPRSQTLPIVFTPEPETGALLGLGLVALAVRRRAAPRLRAGGSAPPA